MLGAIGGERRLSFGHWRYRLLHWVFGISPQSPGESKLAPCLYTHYCPLFHLTNMLAILLPFIVGIRVSMSVSRLVLSVLRMAFRKMADVIRGDEAKSARRMLLENLRKLLVRDGLARNWSAFTACWIDQYRGLGDDLKQIHADMVEAIVAEESRASRVKEVVRNKMALIVGCSSFLFKSLVNVLYLLISAGVLYVIYLFALVVVELWSLNWIPGLIIVGKFLLAIGVPAAALAFMLRYGWFRIGFDAVVSAAVSASPPVAVLHRVARAPIKWSLSIAKSMREFFAVFYEDNCPPITIVSEQEEQVAELVK